MENKYSNPFDAIGYGTYTVACLFPEAICLLIFIDTMVTKVFGKNALYFYIALAAGTAFVIWRIGESSWHGATKGIAIGSLATLIAGIGIFLIIGNVTQNHKFMMVATVIIMLCDILVLTGYYNIGKNRVFGWSLIGFHLGNMACLLNESAVQAGISKIPNILKRIPIIKDMPENYCFIAISVSLIVFLVVLNGTDYIDLKRFAKMLVTIVVVGFLGYTIGNSVAGSFRFIWCPVLLAGAGIGIFGNLIFENMTNAK